MNLYLISRCILVLESNTYHFKIEGALFGKYVKLAVLRSKEKCFVVGSEYLIYIGEGKVEGSQLVGRVLSSKKLCNIKRDFL